MIVKKYIANTVEEAQKVIRQELGPKAVVLTLRYVKQKGWRALFAPNNVEVTAAIEEEDLKDHAGGKIVAATKEKPSSQKSFGKNNALGDSLEDLKRFIQEDSPEEESFQKKDFSVQEPLSPVKTDSLGAYGDPRLRSFQQKLSRSPVEKPSYQQKDSSLSLEDQERAMRKLEALRRQMPKKEGQQKNVVEPSPAKEVFQVSQGLMEAFPSKQQENPQEEKPPIEQNSINQLETLRRLVREELAQVAPKTSEEHSFEDSSPLTSIAKFLVSKGVDRSIAKDLQKKVEDNSSFVADERDEKRQKIKNLQKILAETIQTTGPLLLKKGDLTVAAIVGPTGVGKTTTLIKIAAQYVQLGKRVAIISLDTTKVGAREQIKALSASFGCSLTVANNTFDLQQALLKYSDSDLVLIDTAGISQYYRQQIDALAETLSVVDNLQTLLAVSATTKDVDIYGTISNFSGFDIDSLIVTKTDETLAQGLMVNICKKTAKPIRYISMGQLIPNDIAVADSEQIARKMIVHNNAPELDAIKNLVTV